MAALKREEIDLRKAEIDAKVSIAEMESKARIDVAKMQYDGMMMQATEKLNQGERDRSAKMQMADTVTGQKERSLAVEVAMARQTGESAGGAV